MCQLNGDALCLLFPKRWESQAELTAFAVVTVGQSGTKFPYYGAKRRNHVRFILNNLCAPYTWQILTAVAELSSLYLSFCSSLMIFRIIISKYPQYIVLWPTHLLRRNLEVGLMQNTWIRSTGKVSGEGTFPSIFIWCKRKPAIYRQSCSKQKLTGSPGFVTLWEIENILGLFNKHSVVCDWLWSNCSNGGEYYAQHESATLSSWNSWQQRKLPNSLQNSSP